MKILIERTDGGITILHVNKPHVDEIDAKPLKPAERAKAKQELAMDAVIKWDSCHIDPETKALRTEVVSWHILSYDHDLPTDRTFRDAWHFDDGVKVHMGKAKDIRRQHLRHRREALMAEADVDMFKALEGMMDQIASLGVDTKELRKVIERKRKLRRVTEHPDIDAARTPEELKTAGEDHLV